MRAGRKTAREKRAECGGSGSERKGEKIRRWNRELFANLYVCKKEGRERASKEEMVKNRNRDLVVVREQEAAIIRG